MADYSPNRSCEICGALFYTPPSQFKRGRGRFCSNTCKGRFGRSKQDTHGSANPGWKGGVWKANTMEKVRRWNATHTKERQAHHAVQEAVKRGRLIRQPCEMCGAAQVDGHHEDYDRPLEVRWLCRRCHLLHHRAA